MKAAKVLPSWRGWIACEACLQADIAANKSDAPSSQQPYLVALHFTGIFQAKSCVASRHI
jgi:hypothetical protein